MRLVRSLAQDGPVRHDAEQKSGTCLDTLGDLFHTYEVTDKEAKMVKLLSQIDPRVILGIGLNYKEHAKEQGVQLPERPLVFIKAPNSLSHPGDPIVIPTHLRSTEVDYEGELAVVIGRDSRTLAKPTPLILCSATPQPMMSRPGTGKRSSAVANFSGSTALILLLTCCR